MHVYVCIYICLNDDELCMLKPEINLCSVLIVMLCLPDICRFVGLTMVPCQPTNNSVILIALTDISVEHNLCTSDSGYIYVTTAELCKKSNISSIGGFSLSLFYTYM